MEWIPIKKSNKNTFRNNLFIYSRKVSNSQILKIANTHNLSNVREKPKPTEHNKLKRTLGKYEKPCAIWYDLYNLKNMKNTYGGA